MTGERAEAGIVETLGDERVLRELRVEVAEVSRRLARVFPDEGGTDRFAGVRRHRVRALEHRALLGERVEVRGDPLVVSGEAELVSAQRVDGEEDDVERAIG